MSPYNSLFESIEECQYPKTISLASREGTMRVMGIGQVRTETMRLKQVLYVPELRTNLFSMAVGDRNGLTHSGTKSRITSCFEGTEVFTAKLDGNIYIANFKLIKNEKGIATAATLSEWHARFGHVSIETIEKMMREKVVDGLEIQRDCREDCVDCCLNKCKRSSHPKRTAPSATKPGSV